MVAAGVCVTCSAPAASADSGPRFTPGAPGVGDPYFPMLGNGGYDVQHYALDVAYDPDHDQLDGTATITARATQDLSRFDLDLSGLDVSKVTVDGRPAAYRRYGTELIITPAQRGLRKGRVFRVAVGYGGVPQTIVGSPIVFGSPYGFLHTPDGAFVGDEPNAASTWYPCNDHPSDKATFDFVTTVPKDLTVVANGDLVGTRARTASFSRRRAAAPAMTYHWQEKAVMATYLATLNIGKTKVKKGRTPGGVPLYVAVDSELAKNPPDPEVMDDYYRTKPKGWTVPANDRTSYYYYNVTAQATDLWTRMYGAYPFSTTGAIVDDAKFAGEPLAFSLETQSKPVYTAIRDDTTIAHELAHQWFGDLVSVQSWKHLWLNESFATWSMWYWDETLGRKSAAQQARDTYNNYPDSWWSTAIADPKRDTMFSSFRVYAGGAMMLEFLREKMGHETFIQLLRMWINDHKYGNATTEQFTALAQEISGQDLGGFFKTWLYSPGKPARLPQGLPANSPAAPAAPAAPAKQSA